MIVNYDIRKTYHMKEAYQVAMPDKFDMDLSQELQHHVCCYILDLGLRHVARRHLDSRRGMAMYFMGKTPDSNGDCQAARSTSHLCDLCHILLETNICFLVEPISKIGFSPRGI